MTVLGMLFMVQLNYFLGLLTLKYQGIGTFLMIKSNLAALVMGSIIPLSLFPEVIVKIMQLMISMVWKKYIRKYDGVGI